MPVVVFVDGGDDMLTPWSHVEVTSDFVGPLPLGSQFRVDAFLDTDFTIGGSTVFVDTSTTSVIFNWLKPEPPLHWITWTPIPNDTILHVRQQLLDDTGAILDSGTRTIRWDATAGLSTQIRETASVPAAPSFTATDRTTLNATLAAMNVGAPGAGVLGGFASVALGTLLSGFSSRRVNRHGSILVSGQGSLTMGAEPFRIDALGMEWHWNTIPAGFGLSIGNVDNYFNRVVQWRLIGEDSSHQLFQLDVIDSSVEGVRHMWGIDQPLTVEWFVAPGCVVELSFLVLALG